MTQKYISQSSASSSSATSSIEMTVTALASVTLDLEKSKTVHFDKWLSTVKLTGDVNETSIIIYDPNKSRDVLRAVMGSIGGLLYGTEVIEKAYSLDKNVKMLLRNRVISAAKKIIAHALFDVTKPDKRQGRTPLHYAIRHGYSEVVKELLNKASSSNVDINLMLLKQDTTPGKYTPLGLLGRTEIGKEARLSIISELLKINSLWTEIRSLLTKLQKGLQDTGETMSPDEITNALLKIKAEHDKEQINIAEFVLAQKGDIYQGDSSSSSSSSASTNGITVDKYIEKVIEYSSKSSGWAVNFAEGVDLSLKKWLDQNNFKLNDDADVNFMKKTMGSEKTMGSIGYLLTKTVDSFSKARFLQNRALAVSKKIIDHPKFDITKADNIGRTPLHYVIRYGATDVLRYLLNKAISEHKDINSLLQTKDDTGNIPISFLWRPTKGYEQENRDDMVTVLLEHQNILSKAMVSLLRDLQSFHHNEPQKSPEEVVKILNAQNIFNQQIEIMIKTRGTSLMELNTQLGKGAKFSWFTQDVPSEVINSLFQLCAQKQVLMNTKI